MTIEDKSGLPDKTAETDTILIPQYKIILHNDDVTPMDFVVMVLTRFFVSDGGKAKEIMRTAHQDGTAIVDTMPLERAEFKVERAHQFSRANSFPLTFSIEPV